MKLPLSLFALTAALATPSVGLAETAMSPGKSARLLSGQELPPYLQCVPYAREQSGVEIYGDAHTWWDKAEGAFERGSRPKVGAVMAFQPHRNMRLGHVAAVSKVIDSRTVLLRHSNWSPINGRRGQIENDVKAIDVSPNNDWSAVRVWYHPIQALGKTAWPIHGFIYSKKVPNFAKPIVATPRFAGRPTSSRQAVSAKPISAKPSTSFTNAFADMGTKPAARLAPLRTVHRSAAQPAAKRMVNQRTGRVQTRSNRSERTNDSVAAAISLYD